MNGVETHYERFLAPIYVWMAGGLEPAWAAAAEELAGHVQHAARALDLGAGFGMHAIPLARTGAQVLAIDASAELLATLRQAASGLDTLRAVQGDLCGFRMHLAEGSAPDLILCMGDTLAHLPDENALESLVRDVKQALCPGGRFLASFRTHEERPGTRKSVLVRADDRRILTCVLDIGESRVGVTDILHQHDGLGWQLHTSSYTKLRLHTAQLVKLLVAHGLQPRVSTRPNGAVMVVAEHAC